MTSPHLRPPRISGMAMPGGVHLATSAYGTGANWELFVAGLTMALLMGIAAVPAYVNAWVIGQLSGLPVVSVMLQAPVTSTPAAFAIAELILNVVWMLCFMCILWLSPLAGYHAAEHQTVTCIERFGDVIPGVVEQMPRAHPRCGTNWLAGILPLMLFSIPLWLLSPVISVFVGMIGLYFRNYIGYFLQQYLTTKPPSEKQLRAGIQSGKRIMLAWRNAPDLKLTPGAAIWRRGFLQTLAGVILGMVLLGQLAGHLHIMLGW